MGKKRRGAAATGGKKLYQLAATKKCISKEKKGRGKGKKKIAKPKVLQLNRKLKSAVEEVVRQLSNSRQQTFTLAQVRRAYQERFDNNGLTKITPSILRSIHGIYNGKKRGKFFYNPEERDLRTAVAKLLGQLPGDCFTRKQVENVYKKKFKKKTLISSKFLRSIHGVYGKRESNGMEKTFFFFPKTMKSGLFAEQCYHVATRNKTSPFSFRHFKSRFIALFSCFQVPWQKSDSAMEDYLASIPGLRRLPDKKFCIERTEEEEMIEISGTEEEELRQEGERTSTGENRGLKSEVEEVIRQLSNSPHQTFTLAQVRRAYQVRYERNDATEIARITPSFLHSIRGVYSEKKTSKFFYYPKALESGLFLKQCAKVVEGIEENPFSFKKFGKCFKKTFSYSQLAWRGGSRVVLESIPGLEKTRDKKYRRVQWFSDEVIVIGETEGGKEFGENGGHEAGGEVTPELSNVISRSEEVLHTLPVPFRPPDFYVAFFNAVGEPVPPLKNLGLSRERDLFLSIPRVYVEGYTDNYYYLPTTVDSGVFYNHCLFVWNRSPTRFGYHKFCRIFKEIFDVRRFPWLEMNSWREIIGSHPRMHMDEEGKYSLMPLTYDEESGEEREQPKEENGTRKGDAVRAIVKQEIDRDFIVNRLVSDEEEPPEAENTEQPMPSASKQKRKVVKRKKRSFREIEENGQEAKQKKLKKRKKTELPPETLPVASSKGGDVGQVVVNMLEYAEKRGVDMDELTAAVLRTITDRL